MTDRHMGIKTLLMQNLDSAHYLFVLQIVRAMRYLSAHKGGATMLLLPTCLSVCSMNCNSRVNNTWIKQENGEAGISNCCYSPILPFSKSRRERTVYLRTCY